MEKRFLIIVGGLWLVLALGNILAPKQDFSETENRYLAPLPPLSAGDVVGGKYTMGLNNYFNDHFVGRDLWVGVQSTAEFLTGKRENNSVFIGSNTLIEKIPDPDDKTSGANIRGIGDFVKKTGITSYVLLVPSAEGVQAGMLPAFASGFDQQAYIDGVYRSVKGAQGIDVFSALKAHSDEYIYYRTDHHWTAEGAYLAYRQAAQILGIPVRDYESFGVHQVSNSFLGTLSSKSGFRFITPDVMEAAADTGATLTVPGGKGAKDYTSIYFSDWLSKKDKYSYFLGPNEAVVTVKTGVPGGKKLLVFKDSYAHTLVPYLLKDYSEITLVDLRYLNTDLAKSVDLRAYSQALFLYGVDVFSHSGVTSKLSALGG